MASSQPSSPGLERRVADLHDFSLDITRHDGDLAFAKSGGTIHYVMDENVLELFVNPSENYNYVMRDDVRPTKGRAPSDREIQAMQSALLTGEALLNGWLPGQRSQTCYLTEWHRWEALERVSQFISHAAKAEAQPLRDAMANAIRAKALLREEGELDEVAGVDPFLETDMLRLHDILELDPEIAKRMARVRAAATVLARDRRSEPIHQLNRVLRFEVDGQLRLLTDIASPDRRETARLARDAQTWDRLIRNEANARAARHGTKNKKSRTAVWNDAQSMALVEWVSKRLDPQKERVVLVTGDTTLFDAYRRAFELQPERGEARLTPFLLRRPLQYSTLFSVDDKTMGNMRQELFYSLQQLVELPLTPIRIASVGSTTLDNDVLFRRHSLTLGRIGNALDRRPYFNDVWRAFGDDYREEQIDVVEQQIEETERFLNGLSSHLVERRIGDEHERIIKRSAGDARERDRLVGEYVARAVEALMRSALEVWRPEAEAFFRRAAVEGPKLTGRRVPLAIAPEFDTERRGELLSMLDTLLEDPIEEGSGGRPVTFRVSSSFDLFLGAAAVALHGNQWRLGDHFCEVAINAFTYLSKYEDTTESDAAEAHYLAALAKRFRLGDVRIFAHADLSGSDKLFEKALVLLRTSEELSGRAGVGFVSYRAYSERAALCLFHATQHHRGSASGSTARRGQARVERSREIFADAGACLSEALRIQSRSGFDGTRPAMHGQPLQRLRLQVLINIASWYALRPIISPDEPDRPDLARECAVALPQLQDVLNRSGAPLFEMEVNAFRLSQRLEARRDVRSLASWRAQGLRALEVDRVIYKLVEEYWFRREEQRPTRVSV